jgi:hypothetical protein
MLAMEAYDNAGNLTPRGALPGSSRAGSPLQGTRIKKPRHSLNAGAFCWAKDYCATGKLRSRATRIR